LVSLLDFILGFGNITIVCHPNADPDCIGSAYALITFLRKRLPRGHAVILASEGISMVSERLMDYLQLQPVIDLPEATDLYVLVDTSSIDQVPAVKRAVENGKVPYAIVDHHVSDERTVGDAAFSLVKECSSTCEIIFEALDKKSLNKKAFQALLVGIIYDSRRFLILPDSTILAASKLIDLGAKADLALSLLSLEQDPSERMAKLKGAARLRLYKASDWLIAVTNVGSFEASVARSLTDLGADVALVINEDGKSIRLSGRSTESIFKKTGLNLAKDLMQPIAESFSGQGGGHPTAASVNLKGSLGKVMPLAMDLIASKLCIKGSSIKEIHTKK
jgi:nanoRNase/pAp phosphatase (c-di-AMP/oligoRNAs hydrolase)